MKKLLFYIAFLLNAATLCAQPLPVYTSAGKDTVALDSLIGNKNAVCITAGFRSCQDCYKELIIYLSEIKLPLQIFCINEYKETVFARKTAVKHIRELLADSTITVLFDDPMNSTFTANDMDITPGMILIRPGKRMAIRYEDIFEEAGVKENVRQKIEAFFK